MRNSQPDWDLWLRMPRLSMREALALSFGRDPETDSAHGRPEGYSLRQKLFERTFNRLPTPQEFSAWAQDLDLNIPLPLAQLALKDRVLPPVATDDVIDAALGPLVMPGKIAEVRSEIAKMGSHFVMVDGALHLHIEDGTWRGKCPAFERWVLFELSNKNNTLAGMVLASGASGSGAPQTAFRSDFSEGPQDAPPITPDTPLNISEKDQGHAPIAPITQAMPLTTGEIAFCFDGLGWDEAGWRRPLGDKPKWIRPCVAIPGVQGKMETRWNPVSIGGALVQQDKASVRNVRARFQSKPRLKEWLDAWKTYEADNFESA